jgi:hypothetical protein
MLGQTLRQIQVPAGQKQVTLSLEPLSPGTYFLQLMAPDKTFATQRFILK